MLLALIGGLRVVANTDTPSSIRPDLRDLVVDTALIMAEEKGSWSAVRLHDVEGSGPGLGGDDHAGSSNRKRSNDIEKSGGNTGAGARSDFLSGRSCRDVVELCGHDEVVLVQALNLLRLQRDGHVAPAEADVGVMSLGFRQMCNLPDEGKRLREVPELECSRDPPRLVLAKYDETTDRRILAVLGRPPPEGYARWTGGLVAEALGDVSDQYVWRFLRAQKIDLDGRKSWCESHDPDFVAKTAEIIGLYLDPPEGALVLAVDEKPHIQALERAQGYLKLKNGPHPHRTQPSDLPDI